MKKIRVAESNFRQRKKNVPFQPHNPKLCLFHLECIHWVFCSAVFVRRPVGLKTQPCRNTAREQKKLFSTLFQQLLKKTEGKQNEGAPSKVGAEGAGLFVQTTGVGGRKCLLRDPKKSSINSIETQRSTQSIPVGFVPKTNVQAAEANKTIYLNFSRNLST